MSRHNKVARQPLTSAHISSYRRIASEHVAHSRSWACCRSSSLPSRSWVGSESPVFFDHTLHSTVAALSAWLRMH